MKNENSNYSVPHINQCKFLNGLDLCSRWNVDWKDIINMMLYDDLETETYKRYIKEKKLYKIDDFLKKTFQRSYDPFESKDGEISFAMYCEIIPPENFAFALETSIWPYEKKHPMLKEAARSYYEMQKVSSNKIKREDKYPEYIYMPPFSGTREEKQRQKVKWFKEHGIRNFDIKRSIVNESQKYFEGTEKFQELCKTSTRRVHVFEDFPPFLEHFDKSITKNRAIAAFLKSKRFPNIKIGKILNKKIVDLGTYKTTGSRYAKAGKILLEQMYREDKK
ncbi:hypothetical protein ACTVJH_07815 [Desulfoplanes sp. PS50]